MGFKGKESNYYMIRWFSKLNYRRRPGKVRYQCIIRSAINQLIIIKIKLEMIIITKKRQAPRNYE